MGRVGPRGMARRGPAGRDGRQDTGCPGLEVGGGANVLRMHHKDCLGKREWGWIMASLECRAPVLALSSVGRRAGWSHSFPSLFPIMHF